MRNYGTIQIMDPPLLGLLLSIKIARFWDQNKFLESRKHSIRGTFYHQLHLTQSLYRNIRPIQLMQQ